MIYDFDMLDTQKSLLVLLCVCTNFTLDFLLTMMYYNCTIFLEFCKLTYHVVGS